MIVADELVESGYALFKVLT